MGNNRTKKKIAKKIISIAMSLCIMCSVCASNAMTVSTQANGGPVSVQGAFTSGATSMAVSKLYTFGLSVVGTGLTKVAESTDIEAFKKMTSFLDKWVFGNGAKKANAAIMDLCKQILAELKVIERTMSAYTAQIAQSLGEQNYMNAMKTVNAKWETDVHSLEGSGIEDALNQYKAYMEIADNYAAGEASEQDMDAAKEALFDEFCNIYKTKATIPVEDNSPEKLKERIFGDTIVNDLLHNSISTMKNNLVKDTNYADVLAQFAYQSLPFADQQGDYVKMGINQQLTEILLLEMLHQEFLGQYGEFLEEKYPEHESKWSGYQKLIKDFDKLNEEVTINIGKMLDRELKAYPAQNVFIRLEQYPTEADTGEMLLHNNDYITDWSDNSYGYKVSNIRMTENEPFRRAFTLTGTGLNTFYIDTGTPEGMSIATMDYKYNVTAGPDVHYPSADYKNLLTKSYTDGQNSNIKSPGARGISQLFNTNVYNMSGSQMQKYLSRYYGYAGNKPVFLIFKGYKDTFTGVFRTGYCTLTNVVKAWETRPFADISEGKTTELSLEDVQEGKNFHDTYYSVILTNQEGKGSYKLNAAISGSDKADIYIEGDGTAEGDEKRPKSMVQEEGKTCKVRFKATSNEDIIKSLTLQRHYNAADLSEVTDETLLLDHNQIQNMTPDEDGYYTFECPSCYSNATVLLTLETGCHVTTIRSGAEQGTLTFDAGTDYYLPGDIVDFTVSEEVDHVYLHTGKNTTTELELTENAKGERGGSFRMPAEDVRLSYVTSVKNHHYNANGFCTDCGYYQPAVLNKDGVYEIANAGQMFWFASYVNGDDSLADFEIDPDGMQLKHEDAKAALLADINLEERDWRPIASYSGIFDGQNHTVSGLKITNTHNSHAALFGEIYRGTIKNFTVKGEILLGTDSGWLSGTGGDWLSGVGGVAGMADGAHISNIGSYVDISNTTGELKHVGGLVGGVDRVKNVGLVPNAETIIDRCVYGGSLRVINSTDCIGGLAGYTNSDARISNCANLGTVETTKDGAFTGGILGYVNDTNPSIQNSYNYGTVSNQGNNTYCGSIIGWARNVDAAKLVNNYVLDSASTLAYGSGSKAGLSADVRTKEAFASGEVAYLLNNGVTDGTQAWYQNIDNEFTPDEYPKFEGGTVYYVEDHKQYSNDPNGKKEPDAFEKDEEGNLRIRTYDDLVLLSQLVRSDYKTYGAQNYVLENNILAASDSVWSEGIGSVSEQKPFNGTFNGNGYCIMGLNISSPEYGGLFEYIGRSGSVSNLFVLHVSYPSDCANAGSIAAVNEGTIDHCTNGINVGSALIFNNPHTNEPMKAYELNSEVKGTLSGGIAARNEGTIIGCRNAGIVTGTECGGIAGQNTGTLYGCANNGVIGTANSSMTKISGGLAGKNGGEIAGCYNSAKIYGKSETAVGSIAGLNGYDQMTDPKVKNVFHITINGLHAVGTSSLEKSVDSSNVVKKQSEMKTDAFTEELNHVTDERVTWSRSSSVNGGYPKIDTDIIFRMMTKTLSNGLTVKGTMHLSLNISYDEFEENSEAYHSFIADLNQANQPQEAAGRARMGENICLASVAGERTALKGYQASLTDTNGNPAFAEFWTQGNIELSVPAPHKDVTLVGLGSDGTVIECAPISYENGIAVFQVPEPVSFILADNSNQNSKPDDSGNGQPRPTDAANAAGPNKQNPAADADKQADAPANTAAKLVNSTKNPANTTVKPVNTGDEANLCLWFLTAAAASCLLLSSGVKRMRRKNETE